MPNKTAIYSVTVTSRGRITIPKEVRQSLGIKGGDWVGLISESDDIRVVKVENIHDADAANQSAGK